MRCFLLQDYVTIRGAAAVTTVTQGELAWLDLEAFSDLVVWLHVAEFSPGAPTNVQMSYETAASRDDALFVAMSGPTTISSTGVSVTSLLKESVTNPLARFVRWRLSMTGTAATWDIVFRIIVAANSPGGKRAAMPVAPDTVARMMRDGSVPSVPMQFGGAGAAPTTTFGQRADLGGGVVSSLSGIGATGRLP